MLFIVRFTDKSDSSGIRQRFLPDHLEWLAEHHDVVLAAGSLRAEPGDDPSGAWWVIEAQSKSEADALLHTDPFWLEGLRESYEILVWSKAFPERKSLV